MKSYYFSEFPYHEYPDEEGEKYPSLRLTFPNTWFNPNTANGLFKRYFDECVYADELGFDGIMLNEHHNTPSCMNAATNLSAAVLAPHHPPGQNPAVGQHPAHSRQPRPPGRRAGHD